MSHEMDLYQMGVSAPMVEIPLDKGYKMIIDAEDYERVMQYKWHARTSYNTTYALHTINHRYKLFLHRFILNLDDNQICDHINRNGLDNRECNLRTATKAQNSMNRGKQKGVYSSQYKGVSWDKRCKRWAANIQPKGKSLFLGRFKSEEDAARAYDKKAREIYGEYAKLNLKE